MAEHFAKKEAKIILSGISEEKLKEAEKDIKTLGAEVFSFKADVSKEEDAGKLMQSAVKQFGSLDVAILNAGILRYGLLVKTDKETGKVISKMSLSNWQSVIDVNLTGVFLTGREAAIQMIESKSKGVIIIPIASVAMHGNPGQTNYSAAKAGVASMTKLWAKDK